MMPFLGAAVDAAVGVWTVTFAIGAFFIRNQKRGVAEAKTKVEEYIAENYAARYARGSDSEVN